MLGQRRRQWINIKSALDERPVFDGWNRLGWLQGPLAVVADDTSLRVTVDLVIFAGF